jgi:beta-N-acetylhexosaminidase
VKRLHVHGAVATALVLSGSLALAGAGAPPEVARPGGPVEAVALASETPRPVTPFASPEENARARDLVAGMTLAEKAGQVIVATYAGYGSPAAMVREYHLGGAVPVGDNIRSTAQITKVVASIRAAVEERGYPAFVGVDQEGGRVTRIPNGSPSLMTAGAARQPARTSSLAKAMGLEMRRIGFTAVLAPVADMTIGLADPIIGTRSASSWPGVASSQVTAASAGLVAAGVIPTIKHFPGHGSITTDTHVALGVQRRSLAELRRKDLVPFQRAIDAGAPAIMTGHIDVRAVAPRVPASLSWRVTTDLLRGTMGFRGLVVTDSLGMGAITRRHSSAEASVRALLAGADVVLMPPDAVAARRGIVKAVRDGRLPLWRLEQAATRMIATLLHQQPVQPQGAALGSSRAPSLALAAAGLTQVSGRCRGRLVGTTIRVTGPRSSRFAAVAKSEGMQVGSTGTLVALATTSTPPPAQVAVALDRPQVLSRAKAPVRLAAYGEGGPTLRAVVRRLMGKSTAPGRLPTGIGGVERTGC